MVTFTIPSELRPVCRRYPKQLYAIILRESAAALADVVATKTKGGRNGCIAVLHTWGRKMQHHPHVHCMVPAIALAKDQATLVQPATSEKFLVHYRPLAARFRSRIYTALKTQHPDIYTTPPKKHSNHSARKRPGTSNSSTSAGASPPSDTSPATSSVAPSPPSGSSATTAKATSCYDGPVAPPTRPPSSRSIRTNNTEGWRCFRRSEA